MQGYYGYPPEPSQNFGLVGVWSLDHCIPLCPPGVPHDWGDGGYSSRYGRDSGTQCALREIGGPVVRGTGGTVVAKSRNQAKQRDAGLTDLGEEAYAHRGPHADHGVDLAQPDHREDHEGQQLVREELEQEEQDADL